MVFGFCPITSFPCFSSNVSFGFPNAMKNEDDMRRLRNKIRVAATLVRVRNTPSSKGVSASSTSIGTLFVSIVGKITLVASPRVESEVQISLVRSVKVRRLLVGEGRKGYPLFSS